MLIKEADIFDQAGPATFIDMSVNRGYQICNNQFNFVISRYSFLLN